MKLNWTVRDTSRVFYITKRLAVFSLSLMLFFLFVCFRWQKAYYSTVCGLLFKKSLGRWAYSSTCLWSIGITGCAVCVNGDTSLNREIANFNPLQNQTTPITIKFVTVDYVSEATPHAKFSANLSTGGFWANVWDITKNFYLYLFLERTTDLQVRPLVRFWRMMAQIRGIG